MRICVIPARGGSKRIPRKNIRDFRGKPMLAWSIEAALKSKIFDHVIVSSDDQEIEKEAKEWGATTPFRRPESLANDLCGTTPVVAHATKWLMDRGVEVEAVCCLYATAPFVEVNDIKASYQLLQETHPTRFVFTATEYHFPIQRSIRIDQDTGLAQMQDPDSFNVRSQDLEPAFHDAGQLYWGRPEAWLTSKNLFEGSRALIIPSWRVQDIDTLDDWTRAELLHQMLTQSHHKD